MPACLPTKPRLMLACKRVECLPACWRRHSIPSACPAPDLPARLPASHPPSPLCLPAAVLSAVADPLAEMCTRSSEALNPNASSRWVHRSCAGRSSSWGACYVPALLSSPTALLPSSIAASQ